MMNGVKYGFSEIFQKIGVLTLRIFIIVLIFKTQLGQKHSRYRNGK